MSQKVYCRCGKMFMSYSFLSQHIAKSHSGMFKSSLDRMKVPVKDEDNLIELGVNE